MVYTSALLSPIAIGFPHQLLRQRTRIHFLCLEPELLKRCGSYVVGHFVLLRLECLRGCGPIIRVYEFNLHHSGPYVVAAAVVLLTQLTKLILSYRLKRSESGMQIVDVFFRCGKVSGGGTLMLLRPQFNPNICGYYGRNTLHPWKPQSLLKYEVFPSVIRY